MIFQGPVIFVGAQRGRLGQGLVDQSAGSRHMTLLKSKTRTNQMLARVAFGTVAFDALPRPHCAAVSIGGTPPKGQLS
jgi:hypothetical protein